MTNRLYCSECKHCRPERSLRTVWGARVEASMRGARCSGDAERRSMSQGDLSHWGIWDDPRPPRCAIMRAPGVECPQFFPATAAAEAKQTMMKLAGEPNAAQKQGLSGSLQGRIRPLLTVGTSSGGGK
jgi:hypothetical protein